MIRFILILATLLSFGIVTLARAETTTASEAAPMTAATGAARGWTCSVLCGYYLESAITYDPSQDITLAWGASSDAAYLRAKQACTQILIGEGKFKEREYPILLVEQATSTGAATVRATVANACVKN